MTALLLASSWLAWRGISRARFSLWNSEHNARFVSDNRKGTRALKASTLVCGGLFGVVWKQLFSKNRQVDN